MIMNKTRSEQGYSTIEFLITFPVIFAVFIMIIYFGLMMKSKLALTNATHAAVQVLSKTKDCSKAFAYLKANFDRPGVVQKTCNAGTESVYEAEYIYTGDTIIFFSFPPTTLTAKSVAFTEKE
jgi:Flp pilus assembly protein TadG